jgi:phenylacetate-CoA ligase
VFNSKIYVNSPIWAQELLIAVRGFVRGSLRERGRFDRVLRDLVRTERLSRQELLELQQRRTVAITRHAVNNVPYYRELFRRYGMDPEDVRSIKDLQHIPFLTKADVLREQSDLIAKNIRGPKLAIKTSGSTGTPLTILQNLDAVTRENAFIWRQLLWTGFKRGERRVWLRGDMIVPIDQRDPPYWRFDRTSNMLMMSSYHISDTNFQHYIRALESFDPVLIQAYPSAIALLASFLDSRGKEYEGRSLRAVVTSSETLRPDQRAVVERRLGCRIFDHYGAAERVALICTCEYGNHHLMVDYSYVELIETDDGSVEIVGTGFNNWLMPFLRYRTGDLVVMANDACACLCERHFPLVEQVEGRRDDYIMTADGRKITRLGHVFTGLNNIVEAQLVQDQVGEVCVYVVPKEHFSDTDKAEIRDKVSQRLGSEIRTTIQLVPKIVRGRNGKFRTVVNRVVIKRSQNGVSD